MHTEAASLLQVADDDDSEMSDDEDTNEDVDEHGDEAEDMAARVMSSRPSLLRSPTPR